MTKKITPWKIFSIIISVIMAVILLSGIFLYVSCMIEATKPRLLDYKGVWVCDEMTIDFTKGEVDYIPLVTMTVDGVEYQFRMGFGRNGSTSIGYYEESSKRSVQVMSLTNEVKNGNTCYLKVYKVYKDSFNKFDGKTFVLKKQTAPQTQTQTE